MYRNLLRTFFFEHHKKGSLDLKFQIICKATPHVSAFVEKKFFFWTITKKGSVWLGCLSSFVENIFFFSSNRDYFTFNLYKSQALAHWHLLWKRLPKIPIHGRHVWQSEMSALKPSWVTAPISIGSILVETFKVITVTYVLTSRPP